MKYHHREEKENKTVLNNVEIYLVKNLQEIVLYSIVVCFVVYL